ncbi:unnamed protein product [Arabis nemorensis]|uniref:Uncharacterized protein n=1 Tax=Arabis nemorensis TaxID=586526 RepID=A0A565BE46_9BRAS|nr:unnamed protein product [Arabis nemorensis]
MFLLFSIMISNDLGSDSHEIKPHVSDLSMSILANVHLVNKLIEEMKIPVSDGATSFEDSGTQTRDWDHKGPLLKGPLLQIYDVRVDMDSLRLGQTLSGPGPEIFSDCFDRQSRSPCITMLSPLPLAGVILHRRGPIHRSQSLLPLMAQSTALL